MDIRNKKLLKTAVSLAIFVGVSTPLATKTLVGTPPKNPTEKKLFRLLVVAGGLITQNWSFSKANKKKLGPFQPAAFSPAV